MSDKKPTKQAARLIIPVWGDVYVRKLTSVTLPAVLAPNNLPALCERFDVELVLVTESQMFEPIRRSDSFVAAQKMCPVRFVAIDDLKTDRSIDYGMMLTYALFRGFADLGERMTEVYLLFLNTDFIISDGSLRHLGTLMQDGKRLIHAPSFRVNLEDVWPYLFKRVDESSSALSISSREMVGIALADRHKTVQARIVNQKIYHQTYQDQFYWYVDDDTLIGYQWPVALVAIRPERVLTEPIMFWDFGFVPEAAPTAQPHFIADSDDFFMMELQARNSGQDMIRLGGNDLDELAATLALYATKEHRQSGQHLLIIHAADLPTNLQDVVSESRVYMAEILKRLPPPVSHINHPRLGQWFEETKRRRRGAALEAAKAANSAMAGRRKTSIKVSVLFALQYLHRKLCGAPPKVNQLHPLWSDFFPVSSKLKAWRRGGRQRVLWVSSVESPFESVLGPRVSPAALLMPDAIELAVDGAVYDACLCELGLSELLRISHLYERIRPLIRDGGEIVVSVRANKDVFDGAASILNEMEYPKADISKIYFYGTGATALLRRFALPGLRPIPTRSIVRSAIVSFLLVAAPFILLANKLAGRRNPSTFSRTWTSLLIEFTVQRGKLPAPGRSGSRIL